MHTWHILLAVLTLTGSGQHGLTIAGRTQDCFAGQIIHPAKVDIYLLDPVRSPDVTELLDVMEKQKQDESNIKVFFASYTRLAASVRKADALGHTRSDSTGRFRFSGLNLSPKTSVVVLGIAELEDEPAYYAFASITARRAGVPVTLDFNRGNSCKQKFPKPEVACHLGGWRTLPLMRR